MSSLSAGFLDYFSTLEEPRHINRNYRHKLSDILTIAILGSICGADNWVELSNFGKSKEDWLRGFLELPHGIPSHDTFGRVFSVLDSSTFETCFIQWTQSLRELMEENDCQEIISIDGKTSRCSHNRRKGKNPLHMVSAWASEQGLLLGRIEKRHYTLISAKQDLVFQARWPGLKSIGMLEVKRTVNYETTHSVRYFLTSLGYQ